MFTKKKLNYGIKKNLRKLANKVIQKLYRDAPGDIGKSIMVVGSARSGTTWLADIIASQFPTRIMFEPFNPNLVPEYQTFNYFQYMRPDEEDESLYAFCRRVFSGEIRNSWIDREVKHLFPKRRVIKCIRSGLMLKWIDIHFPEVPKIFIIRHPCAVVLSRLRLGWATDEDINHFLKQPKLIKDFLEDKIDFIYNAKTDVEKHAIIWCITNLVPIKQFSDSELNLFYYEKLANNSEEEIPRLFKILNFPNVVFRKGVLSRPSSTSTLDSQILSGQTLQDQWKKDLSSMDIDNVIYTIDRMGLGYLI